MTEEDTEPRTDREEEDLVAIIRTHFVHMTWPANMANQNLGKMGWHRSNTPDRTHLADSKCRMEPEPEPPVQCEDSMHISDKASLYPGDSGQQFNILESKFKTHLGH